MSRGFSNYGSVILLTAFTLSACGGGGGSRGGGSTPPTPPPPPPTFTVGGSISGLAGSVTLQNTGGAQLIVSANGTFTFAGTVAAGSSYEVTVTAQPELQTCTVANGSGTAAANVTNIAISCVNATPKLGQSQQAIKALRFTWTAESSDVAHYKLFEDATGTSGFTQVGADIDPSVRLFDHIVPLHLRLNARYMVQACGATRCLDSNTVTVSGPLDVAVGYFKAENISELDQFGTSVALSADGTTLAVGVPFEDSNATGAGGNPDNEDAADSGAVYVFVREGAGPRWVQQAYIKASNTQANDNFGGEVALSEDGSTLAVAATKEDSNATGINGNQGDSFFGTDSGAVYVFQRADGVWTQEAYVKASNTAVEDAFGASLALSGDGRTLVVGAANEDSGNGTQADNSRENAGAAYVFFKAGASWLQEAYLKATNIGVVNGDQFGIAVALSADGRTLAVGARNEDSNAAGVNGNDVNDLAENSGAVYVFTRGVVWAPQAYIKASNTGAFDQFGEALALSADGSTLAVGASFEDSNATGIDQDETALASDAGAAYVFVRTGTEWEQQAYVKASNTEQLDIFGRALKLSADGSILAVGARNEDSNAIGIGGDQADNSESNSGAVYVFERSSDVWAQRAYAKPPNTDRLNFFGSSVALSGDGSTLAVAAVDEPGSAPGVGGDQNTPPIAGAGAVYMY